MRYSIEMKIYRHIVFHILVAVFFTAAPSFAEELSDSEAYDRAYTVCSQTVYPFWQPEDGRAIDESRYALTPARLEKIASCMREKGVPAAFDAETLDVVPTGAGFGGDVDIKIEDMFPDDIAVPQENPQQPNNNMLPDPGYTLPEDNPAGYDAVDARLMRELKSGEMYNRKSNADWMPPDIKREIRRRESRSADRPPVRSGTGGVTTGTENNKNGGSNNDARPIFLPR